MDRADRRRTTVTFRGDLDLAASNLVYSVLAEAMDQCDSDIVVNLVGVGYVDVSTVRLLVRSSTVLAARGRRLTVQAAGRCAGRGVELCGGAGLIEDPRAGRDRRAHSDADGAGGSRRFHVTGAETTALHPSLR